MSVDSVAGGAGSTVAGSTKAAGGAAAALGYPGAARLNEKGRVFAKSEVITASFHENLPPDMVKSLGVGGIVNPEAVVGTSSGRYFRISVVRSGDAGEWSITFKEINERPQRISGLFSNLFGRFGIASSPSKTEQTLPVAAGTNSDGVVNLVISATASDALDVWFTTSSSISVWRFSDNLTHTSSNSSLPTVEKLLCKVDARTGIEEKLLDIYGLGDKSAEDMYTEDDASGEVGLAGSLPMQLQLREERALALAVKILDIKLIDSKTGSVDPREPSSTPGERDDDRMETEASQGLDQFTAILLISYNAPETQTNALPVMWQSERRKPAEKSYATVTCRIVTPNMPDNSSRRPNAQDFGLSVDSISPLPYSDAGGPDGAEMSDYYRGVNLPIGSGGTHGAIPGWFFPKMTIVQTTVNRPIARSGENEPPSPQFEDGTLTLLVIAFHGGVVFSDLDGTFKDHLFLKRTRPFPLPVGYGIVASKTKSGLLYGNSSARVSSSSVNLQSSRSQMLPPPTPVQHSQFGHLAYITTMGVVSVQIDFDKIAGVDKRQVSFYSPITSLTNDYSSGGSNQVRSVMEQAMLYGPVPDNPFSFRFSSNVNAGHLMIAAKQLSTEAIASHSKLVPRQLGLSTHLADRASRLDWLIQFINENEVLNRLNASLRMTLATHAEKVAAARGVWAWYDGSYGTQIPSTAIALLGVDKSQNILAQAVDIYHNEEETGGIRSRSRRRSGLQAGDMIISPDSTVIDFDNTMGEDDEMVDNQRQRPSEFHEDEGDTVGIGYVNSVRSFFITKVEDIGELIPCAMKVVKNVVF
ncbi:hypothetical protein FRC17_005325, partial [Serendipita sp. 399]